MSNTVSSYIPSISGSATRNADLLPLPFPARPQALTAYIRFIEVGTILTGNARVFQIGNGTFGDEEALLIMNRGSAGNQFYRFSYNADGNHVQSQLAIAPSIGDGVELMGHLIIDGNDASVQLRQSINGAVATAAAESGTRPLLAAWDRQILYLGRSNTSTTIGFIAVRNVKFHRGVQTIETMRRLAGVI